MHPEQALLITGGTGSFGKTMLRRVLDLPEAQAPGKVIIFSRDEEKQFHQRQEFPDPRVEYFIGDIRDRESCTKALKDVAIVIHAAALKQVPTGEFFPSQMVKTNVLGTENILEAAEAQSVQKFINLSTDKAVYPINAYGMSKALAEKIVMAAAGKNMASGDGTVFCAVRYGNVMGSRGSVIPLFLRQLEEGDTVTVTDGSMTRFLLRLEQATDLVLHAIEHGSRAGCTSKDTRVYGGRAHRSARDTLQSFHPEDDHRCTSGRENPRDTHHCRRTLATSRGVRDLREGEPSPPSVPTSNAEWFPTRSSMTSSPKKSQPREATSPPRTRSSSIPRKRFS